MRRELSAAGVANAARRFASLVTDEFWSRARS